MGAGLNQTGLQLVVAEGNSEWRFVTALVGRELALVKLDVAGAVEGFEGGVEHLPVGRPLVPRGIDGGSINATKSTIEVLEVLGGGRCGRANREDGGEEEGGDHHCTTARGGWAGRAEVEMGEERTTVTGAGL